MINSAKILFVCHANASRSQMAEAIYNSINASNNSGSAGTKVDHPGETLQQRSDRIGGTYTLSVMKNYGLDISQKRRTQITKKMLDDYDVVVNMAAKRYTPKWLQDSPKYRYWPIKDPGMIGYKNTIKTRKLIEEKCENLFSELNS